MIDSNFMPILRLQNDVVRAGALQTGHKKGARILTAFRPLSDRRFILVMVILQVLCRGSIELFADEVTKSPRLTPLVEVIRGIEPSVVALFTPFQNQLVSGSGTVIHEDGYILTNNHVLPQTEGFALLPNTRPMRFRVIARLPESDIALIRLLDLQSPLAIVPVGNSGDLMNGETVVVAGNPGGRGTVFTSGIVSSNAVLDVGANALVMSNYETTRRDKFIQFDAASNRGNSGGPLVNLEGKIIGIVAASVIGEQNVGLAIPIDRVRRQLEMMLEPELIHQRRTGLSIDPEAAFAKVVSVADGSAASIAGLTAEDVIESINERPIRHVIDWFLMLETLLPKRSPLRLLVRRGEEVRSFEIVPQELSPLAAQDVTSVEPGLRYDLYLGKFDFLPDFSKLTSERTGIIDGLELNQIPLTRNDDFAIKFEGFLDIERDGLYRLVIVSDDGSRLLIDGKLVIDHDGNHPPKPSGRLIRLKQGLHALRVEYFQGNGDKELRLFYEACESRETISSGPLRELTVDRFRCTAATATR